MPLFFVLSGYLFKPEPLAQLAAKRTQTLLVPYVFLTALVSLLSTGTVTGDILIGGAWIGGVLGVCWFVTCLFVTQIAYTAADRYRPLVPALIALCVVVTAVMPPVALPWSLDVVPAALIYFWAGHMLRLWPRFGGVARLVAWPLATVGLAAHTTLGIPGPVDMRADMFGTPIVGPVVAVAMSCCVFDLARLATRVPALASILRAPGRASLVILFLHLLMIHRVVAMMPRAPVWVPALVILAIGCATRWALLRVPVIGPLVIGERRVPPAVVAAPGMMPAA